MTDAQILELVHTKVAELIGTNGEWTVIRRAANDTDTIFHSILAQSVSVGIAAAIADARRRLEAGETLTEPQHLAAAVADRPAADVEEPTVMSPAVIEAPAAEEQPVAEPEPVAFGWEPAPITQWTDLRKPVTGEFPIVSHRNAA